MEPISKFELRNDVLWEMVAEVSNGISWRPLATVTELLAARTTIAELTQSQRSVNYISEIHPNPGNESATCSICGALLVCLSCGNHRTESEQQVIAALTEKHAACERQLSQAVADAEQTLADWKKEREDRPK